ncbi:MAG: hypothetical protein EP329_17450 [Deltaproteobacteria bacterium]|nr:MAG: hypothetical protein EP329_17450 [Deltaproteobacteria bacterium]
MSHRAMVLVPTAFAFASVLTLVPGCDYDLPDEEPTSIQSALTPDDLPVVAKVVIDERESPKVTEVSTPGLEVSPSKSSSEEIQTYAWVRHLLISAEPVMRGIPGPCPPPNRVVVTLSDGFGVVGEVTLTAAQLAAPAALAVPCEAERCDAPLTLTVQRQSGDAAVVVTVHELP